MRPSLLALGLFSAPLLMGASVMWLAGASWTRWAGHLAAGVAGLIVYIIVLRLPRFSFKSETALAFTGVMVVACTLFAPDLQGVRRWLIVFGVRLHASQLVMPSLLVFAASRRRCSVALAQGILVVIQSILLLQPDAGQATSVAAASFVLLFGAPRDSASYACASASVAASIVTWLRSDPLPPAPFVEDIVPRAFAVSFWLGCLGVVAIGAAALAPWALTRRSADPVTALAARALSVYFIAATLVTLVGEFPVPLFGFGASSILGLSIGVAMLGRYHSLETTEPSPM